MASDGPRHVYTGTTKIWLGTQIDLEADGFPGANADGDDGNNHDDEDGIVRVPVDEGGAPWCNSSCTGYISATVTGGTGDLYGWFDWNNDGDFDDTDEAQSWTGLSAGEHNLAVTVGTAFDEQNLYARFRLVPQGAGDPGYTGEVNNGEVEDYYWGASRWGPNAVTINNADAGPSGYQWAALAVGAISLISVGTAIFYARKRRKAQI